MPRHRAGGPGMQRYRQIKITDNEADAGKELVNAE